jgi:outer membrane lipoprotein-sorting protein
MRTQIRILVLLLTTQAFCGATARANDLATVEKEILKKWQKHRSLKTKVTQFEGTEAKGSKAAKHGEGTYEFVRNGDAIMFREEMKSSWEVEAGGQKMTFQITLLTICDGKYQYALSERVGLKTALKAKPDPMSGADLKAFFETLRAQYNLKLLDEEAVDGQDAYVIEATPKSERSSQPYKTIVYYFSKDHGFLLKQEQRDKDGKVLQTKSYTELEFDVKIDPKRFEFKAPEGVIVQDMTSE